MLLSLADDAGEFLDRVEVRQWLSCLTRCRSSRSASGVAIPASSITLPSCPASVHSRRRCASLSLLLHTGPIKLPAVWAAIVAEQPDPTTAIDAAEGSSRSEIVRQAQSAWLQRRGDFSPRVERSHQPITKSQRRRLSARLLKLVQSRYTLSAVIKSPPHAYDLGPKGQKCNTIFRSCRGRLLLFRTRYLPRAWGDICPLQRAIQIWPCAYISGISGFARRCTCRCNLPKLPRGMLFKYPSASASDRPGISTRNSSICFRNA